MKTIAIANHKGGCGKTTTAINLSSCLALKNNKILLIDLDPQAHASIGLNVSVENLENSMYEIITDKDIGFDNIVIPVEENLDLAPSNVFLSVVEHQLAGINGRENRLKNKIKEIKKSYDFIIIDCPPSLGFLTFNALVACNELIIPIETSCFALHGLGKLMETVSVIRKKSKHQIKTRPLATIYDKRTKFAKEVLKNITDNFNESLYNTVIRGNVSLREAASYGKTIAQYNKKSIGFLDYQSLSCEMLLEKEITFTYNDPLAKNIKLAGDFNNWKPERTIFTEKNSDGLWCKSLFLKEGTYQYRFVVDGKWKEDPDNQKYITNEFGERNSVLSV